MDVIKQICAPIELEFEEFRKRYSSLFSSANPGVDILLKFLLERKGKLMRPMMMWSMRATSAAENNLPMPYMTIRWRFFWVITLSQWHSDR